MAVNLRLVKSIRANLVPYLSKLVSTAFSNKYLLLTNVGISISLSGLGDVIEQHYEIVTDKLPEWDKVRTRNMALSGTSVGIVCHFWYRYLDSLMPGYTLRTVMKKVIVDQMIGSPISISTFLVSIGYLEGYTKKRVVEEMKEKAWRLYVAEWMIWPPAQFLNFYILPTRFRVLFDNTVSLGYDVYTSYVMHDNNVNKQESS